MGGQENDNDDGDDDPDDQLTEMLNQQEIQKQLFKVIRQEKKDNRKNEPTDAYDSKNQDLFGSNSNNNEEFFKRQMKVLDILRKGQNGIWKHNYQSGTKYELYRVPLKHTKYNGLKFKDVVMILYQKKQIFLIALEVRIANELKVFVNPSDYIFDQNDHFGYVIHSQCPDFDDINGISIDKSEAGNFFIMDYLSMKEPPLNKKELI